MKKIPIFIICALILTACNSPKNDELPTNVSLFDESAFLSLTKESALIPSEGVLSGYSTFDYSLVNYDQENYSDIQKRSYCQIPNSVLTSMTTEELVVSILNYPFIDDFHEHDFSKNTKNERCIGYKKVLNQFNALKIAEQRSDLCEVLNTIYTNVVENYGWDNLERQILEQLILMNDNNLDVNSTEF